MQGTGFTIQQVTSVAFYPSLLVELWQNTSGRKIYHFSVSFPISLRTSEILEVKTMY